ncbi:MULTISPECIES: AAA family ATPase [unclassified Frankia]
MRPHHLTLAAFGAFPGTVEIDFDVLGSGGLLLLCGETGGGKTTLLDAVGFALFGRVPGMRGEVSGPPDLRSHHAAASLRPEVTLEFTVAAGRFRITRSPAWDKPRRGGGTTRAHPTARLERFDGAGGWEMAATRMEDVGHEIDLLVGMSDKQFFQVIMLPQGRFADFLQADHGAREKLLKPLFHVNRFEYAEQWLLDRAKIAAERLALARAELDRVTARVSQVAAVDEPEDPTADAGWAADLAGTAAAAAISADEAAGAAAAWRTSAEEALDQARDLARRVEQRRILAARQEELAAQAPRIELLTTGLDAPRRAAVVAPALDEVRRRTAAVHRAEADERDARNRLGRHPSGLLPGGEPAPSGPLPEEATGRPAEAPAEELARLARLAHTETGRLETLTDTLAAAERDAEEATGADRDTAAHTRSAAELAEAISVTLPRARVEAEARVEVARRAGAALPGLVERARWAKELASAVREGRQVRTVADEAERDASAARTHASDLRRQRFDAITAELAAALVHDTPCPVCGALEHPDPAETRADHVSKDAETAAGQEADRLADAATRAGRAVAHWESRVRALHADLVGPTDGDDRADPNDRADPDDRVEAAFAEIRALPVATLLGGSEAPVADRLDELAAVLTHAVRARTRAAKKLAAAEAALREVHENEKETAARHSAARTAAQAARERAADARGRAARRLAGVPAELCDPEALAARRRAVTALAADHEAAQAAALAAEQARAEHIRAGTAALDQARQAGFSDLDDAAEAVRDSDWMRRAADEVRAHRDELVAVGARLAGEDLAVDPDTEVPLADHETAVADAREVHESTLATAARARERAERLAALVTEFTEKLTTLDPLREAADELRGLADLAAGRGANTERMPLSSFVLAARLEEVAAAASHRLAAMSGGRFTLVHDAGESRDKRRRAGLGLLVDDAWTGRRRDTATLSGGETFQAALSLALGLADVVTAEAGGRRMDALFIDEGFGTLDPDSLDEVMTVLDELRSGGRLVGVVSHVTELRQRIPNQIRVVKGVGGSRVETTS